jgi:hypothetical protein
MRVKLAIVQDLPELKYGTLKREVILCPSNGMFLSVAQVNDVPLLQTSTM